MELRFRLLAALFALSSLILLQVEGLWASSACSIETEAPVISEVAESESRLATCPMSEDRHSHEQDGNSPKAPDCSLMLIDAGSCMGAVALLSSSDKAASAPAGDERSLASSDHAKDLLLAVSLLRPPQA
jgi:hypothetical protein